MPNYNKGRKCISCRTVQTDEPSCPGCKRAFPLTVWAKDWTDADWEVLNA